MSAHEVANRRFGQSVSVILCGIKVPKSGGEGFALELGLHNIE